MTYKTTTLNNFVGTSSPTFVGTTQIDGYVKGRPVVLRRLKNGTLMPTTGTLLPTSMGMGRVVGVSDGNLLMDIIDFNDDYEFINADETEIYDASEKVAMLNKALRMSFESTLATYQRVYKSEITGQLPKSIQLAVDAMFPEISDTTVCMTFSPRIIKGSTPILYKSIATPKLTPAERRKARRLEIAQAKALADALLENESTPSGIQDELDEMYGDDDGEF
ncbi:MAG: hypothetical protein HOI21_16155 [Bacteroidetes Order II. Incertae sedis bacterium]|nr:hypothetical protein [Bacteroidetes Order II. bacterium]